jgi:hypothetical protein
MIYTEIEKNFWKAHSMGCGFRGDFTQKQGYPDDPIIFVCPECGSEYRPKQEHNGELLEFWGDSVDMFSRALDEELIEEIKKRGYKIEKASCRENGEKEEAAESIDKADKIKKLTAKFVETHNRLNELAEQINELEKD